MIEKISYTVKDFNLIVLGGDGDLAFYKLYPSLMYRFIDKQIKSNFNIIAISRKDKKREEFLSEVEKYLKEKISNFSKKDFDEFSKHISVVTLKENNKTEYEKLKNELEKNPKYQNIYYYSTPSSAFEEISQSLKNSGLISDSCKVVVEKPLGSDLKSFRTINNKLRAVFKENQIYRIDHYLGKETVQNLMVLRFTNHLFEKAWNRENIDNIQITVAESVGVNQRGNYYDNTGALLDMVQNHLLQLLCLVAMEPPSALTPENVRAEKLKVLHSIRHFTPDDAQTNSVKGQYTRGNTDGKQVNSYLEDIEKYES
ncbi:MAG: glucose-6-phosphate dehydrogenase, partial [Bacteroidia bacterium]